MESAATSRPPGWSACCTRWGGWGDVFTPPSSHSRAGTRARRMCPPVCASHPSLQAWLQPRPVSPAEPPPSQDGEPDSLGSSGQTPLQQPWGIPLSHLEWEQEPKGLPRTMSTCAVSLARVLVPAHTAPSGAGRGRGWEGGGGVAHRPQGHCAACLPICLLEAWQEAFPPKLGQVVSRAPTRAWDPSL